MKKYTFIFIILSTFLATYALSHFYPLSGVKNLFNNSSESYMTTKYKLRYTVHSSLKVDSTDIVFLGNSITENFEWGEYFKNPHIKNRGIGGDVIKGVINRLNTVGSPKKLFVLIGINDINTGNQIDLIYRDYNNLLNLLKNENHIQEINVISVLPTEGRLAKLNPKILEVNKRLVELCSIVGVRYIDLHSILINEKGELKKEFSVDGVHLTGEAYNSICNILANYID